ncbi:c-type cytochrome [Cytophagaceae bacterium DM2B3-1]|uniref:C-type cytochrome n=1 Tax=Xanthocytophaga flava TaxID=3048013 RepID=A0ABT7CRB0_9BACT|nr:c-type cytochrome [Xanthocytophaga flavus]MDJ1496288.1 c-type cytochrome [Xanthocytophaga flavus]
MEQHYSQQRVQKAASHLYWTAWMIFVIALCIGIWVGTLLLHVEGCNTLISKEGLHSPDNLKQGNNISSIHLESWSPPDEHTIPTNEKGELIRYGKELIVHTSVYLGPKGSVRKMSNGMNCQNCHLEAGTKPFGNNYSAVASTYPKFRQRSGSVETISKRINDCFERSLNGQSLDTTSHEMRAMVAYMQWLGSNVKKGVKPEQAGLPELVPMNRAAEPENGKLLYKQHCLVCHGVKGQGVLAVGGKEYQFPPLWGNHSYNNGAGLYRLSRMAGYVKANMPFGVSFYKPLLSDEDAWDLAAYINTMPRTDIRKGTMLHDWPDIAGKPFDHPFGPFTDSFSEKQHKYGPYEPIMASHKKTK